MSWTERSIVLKPYSKIVEQTERSSCITRARPKIKGISLSKDITHNSNKSAQFIKLTQKGTIKRIERREIKLLVKVKQDQCALKGDRANNFSAISYSDKENSSSRVNVNPKKDGKFTTYTQKYSYSLHTTGRQLRKGKQTRESSQNPALHFRIPKNSIPIVKIL